MTSTSVFKGSFGEKPSSRVLQPPGGGSSNIFAFSENLPQPSVTVEPMKDASVCESMQPRSTGEALNAPAAAAPISSSEVKEVATQSVCGTRPVQQPSSQPMMPRNRSSGFNPITGEPCGDNQVVTKKQSTSITVRQPPGGASSGLW